MPIPTINSATSVPYRDTSGGTTTTLSFVSDGSAICVFVHVVNTVFPGSFVTYNGIPLVRQYYQDLAAAAFHNFTVWTLPVSLPGTFNIIIDHPTTTVEGGIFNYDGGPPDGSIQCGMSFATFGVASAGIVLPAYGDNSLAVGYVTGASTPTSGQSVVFNYASSACGTMPGGGLVNMTWSHAGVISIVGLGFVIPDGSIRLDGGSKQIWGNRLRGNNGDGPDYLTLPTGRYLIANTGWWEGNILTNGTARSLQVTLKDAPSGSKTQTFTVTRNGNDTGLILVFTGTETHKKISASVPFYKYDRFAIKRVGTGSPNLSLFDYSMEVESADVGVSVYGSGAAEAGVGTGEITYNGILFPMEAWNATLGYRENVAGTNGIITEYTVKMPYQSHGASDVEDFYLYKNGIKQDGTAGTVNTHIQITKVDFEIEPMRTVKFALPVAFNDYVYAQCNITLSDSGTLFRPLISCRFVATVAGEFTIGGGGNILNTSVLRYMPASGDNQITGPETDWTITIPPLTSQFFITGAVVKAETAPGGVATWALSNRKNLASPTGISKITLTGVETAGSDDGSLEYVEDDELNATYEPGGSPALSNALIWAFRGFMQAPVISGGLGLGLYYIRADKTSDSLWTEIIGPINAAPTSTKSTVKKIPNPFVVVS